MGNVLPFGRGMGDGSLKGVVDSETDGENVDDIQTEEVSETETQAIETPTPPNPEAIYRAIDSVLRALQIVTQQIITILPIGTITQEEKRDLLSQYATLEETALDLRNRLVPASGDPENLAVAEELQQLVLSAKNFTATAEKHIKAAKNTAIAPRKALISKKTAIYVGAGLVTVLIAGGIFWAYKKNNE